MGIKGAFGVSIFPLYSLYIPYIFIPYIFPIQWGAKELLRVFQPFNRFTAKNADCRDT